MTFPFALSRIMALYVVFLTNGVSLMLSAITLHEKTGSAFQVLGICLNVFSILTIVGCVSHQLAHPDEEASNARNVAMFSVCGLFDLALAISLSVHARQTNGTALCNDFARGASPCVLAGAQLGMAYASTLLAVVGCIIAWIDKFPGAVKVTARYPITKAPSSHFAAHAHDLDGLYTRPPIKTSSSGSRKNSEWSDVPLHC